MATDIQLSESIVEVRPTGQTAPPRESRRRRILWSVLLGILFVAMLGGALAAHEASKRVRVSSTLLVAPQQPRVLPEAGERTTREDFEDYQRTQIALVTSRRVLNAAVKGEPRVLKTRLLSGQEDPLGFLEKHIVADFKLAPQILRISMVGNDPDGQVLIVNAVREAYMKEIVNRGESDRAAQVQRLQDIYNTHEESLRKRRQTLQALREALGVERPAVRPEQEKLLYEDLLDCKRELRRLRLARVACQARADREKDKFRDELAGLNAQVQLLEQEQKELLNQVQKPRKATPDVDAMQEEIARSEKFIAVFANRIEKLKLELQAPGRVSVLETATVETDR